jgi:hypothetical protein
MTSEPTTDTRLLPRAPDHNALEKILMDLLSEIPATAQSQAQNPPETARRLARGAAGKAALVSGGLSLAPGPAGWLTLIPDLVGVWRIQRQMVADIAALFGRTADLGKEEMFYCLFRHVAAHAVADLAVRVGGRAIVRRVPLRILQAAVRRVGIRLTQRVIGRGIARWIPVAGAVGVAGYAYWDTMRVAETAIELFGSTKLPDLVIVPEPLTPP